ncbi:MAG: hypothetical protein Q9196_005488 [Gyalolechia fulgens]
MERSVRNPSTTNPNLSDLPTELRWQIYGYLLRPRDQLIIDDCLLASPESIYEDCVTTSCYSFRQLSARIGSSSAMATYIRSHSEERRRYGEKLKVFTSLLLLNRQIRDEASDCLYGQRLQFACSPDGVEAFFKDRPSEVLRHITDISLLVPSETGRVKFMSLCAFVARNLQLTRLTVRINTFMWEDQPWERLQGAKWSTRDLMELDWVQSLLLIQNLETLNIEFDHRYAAKKLTVGEDFTRMLRKRMLVKRDARELHDLMPTS